ncbi:MAG: hypothetical protein WAW17_25835 [Rhodococcus sp. (in: high G+C Gram-positive bacteria)]|uniref:hypothetical protein n=1 Tax=Rhodococcus sp. TaxID=1831 RepID=UPI003BAE9DFD
MPDRGRWAAVLAAVALTSSVPFAVTGSAGAEPARTEPVFVDASDFVPMCTPDDSALGPVPDETSLAELSGLVSIGGLLYAVGDSGSDRAVAVLDEGCAVQRWLPVPVDPYDIEDLATGPDGRLWLADTGDNGRVRTTVALISMDRGTGVGELHRLTYPDGPHDAETVLIQRDGTPLIVTKEVFGAAGVYRPAGGVGPAGPAGPGPVPLERAGRVETSEEQVVTATNVPTVDSTMFTGGAVSADGAVAALRTYSDVYFYSDPDGDLVKALTAGPVLRVRLPQQPQGEAVAFDEDGDLLVGSEARDGPIPPVQVLRGAVALVQERADGAVTSSGTVDEILSPETVGTRGVIIAAVALAALAAMASVVLVVRRRAR